MLHTLHATYRTETPVKFKVKGKVKVTLEQAMKAQRGRSIVLLFL
jgi:hypothetical protein